MLELLVGLIMGAVLGAVAVLRFGGRFRRGPAAGNETARAVADLRREEPAIASILEQAPAVPPESVPAETNPSEIQSEATLSRFDPDVAKLLRGLRGWRPRSPTYGDEQGYADSMQRHLSRNGLPREGNYETQPALLLALKEGTPRNFAPDFVFWRRVLVEVKGDMSRSSDSDRSLGQIFRYLLAWKHYGPAILIICGDCDPLLRFIVREYIATWRERFRMPVTVFFAQHEAADQVPQIAAV